MNQDKRKPCQHGIKLPQSLRCDHGFIQVYMRVDGTLYSRNFGPHDKLSQQMAEIHLSERRKLVLMGKAGIAPELPVMSFKDVAGIYLKWWKEEKHPDGRLKHTQASQDECEGTLNRDLIPFFGHMPFHEIKPKLIEDGWRLAQLDRGIKSTTVDRRQAVLSSVFTKIKWLIDTERIKPFKQPEVNPCSSVAKSGVQKRTRIPTDYELGKIRWAFGQLNDSDGWAICEMAMETVLSLSDLENLERGHTIDTERLKTGVRVELPINVLSTLNFTNWRHRWVDALKLAGLKFPLSDPRNLQFRDLRKWGINQLQGRFATKDVSMFAGHASEKTTETHYMLKMQEKMKPLAEHLVSRVRAIEPVEPKEGL